MKINCDQGSPSFKCKKKKGIERKYEKNPIRQVKKKNFPTSYVIKFCFSPAPSIDKAD